MTINKTYKNSMAEFFLKLFPFVLILFTSNQLIGQHNYTTNTNPIGLEYNLLFNAGDHYDVTQGGSAQYANESGLFDGRLYPLYTSVAPSYDSPYTVLITGLPASHTQTGAWIGWTTRYWGASRFKIEGYNVHSSSAVGWKTLVDYSDSDYAGNNFMAKVNIGGSYTKLRYTFYKATGSSGRLGLSELIFLHPEATSPYKNLISNSGSWVENSDGISYDGNLGLGQPNPSMKLHLDNLGNFDGINLGSQFKLRTSSAGSNHIVMEKLTQTGNLYLRSASIQNANGSLILNDNGGNVGIGTAYPDAELAVNGNIHTKEVKVDLIGWSDFVFDDKYELPTLKEVENHIKINGHLKDIPSAKEVAKNGILLGEMDSKLLQKIEELMLYTIDLNKRIDILEKENKKIKLKLN